MAEKKMILRMSIIMAAFTYRRICFVYLFIFVCTVYLLMLIYVSKLVSLKIFIATTTTKKEGN